MPRRGFIPKREVLPDPVYGTVVVTKLINQIMLDGKRGVAQQVCYDAFETIAEKSGKEANEVFQQALANVMPQLEVKARRVGGATYQVPMEIRPERRQTLALRWLVEFSRKRGEKTMAERLAAEVTATFVIYASPHISCTPIYPSNSPCSSETATRKCESGFDSSSASPS